MNAAQNAVLRTKKFVRNNKVAITMISTAAVTTTICVKAHRAALADVNEFLKEHGLYETFYNSTES